MRLVWTQQALNDRRTIRAHIARDNAAAALTLDHLFSEKVAQLTDYPSLGHPGRATGTRELKAHRNYVIVYDVQSNVVRVLRVLHAARQWLA